MVYSWGTSVFFAVSAGSLLVGGFLYKKSEDRKPAVLWGIILLILLGCYHTLIAAILDLLTIPVHIVSIAICDLLLSALFWQQIIRKKEFQRYEIKPMDIIFLAAVLIMVIWIAKIHYAGFDLAVNYFSIDAGVHFQYAMNVVNSHQVSGMFHDTLWNALLIEFLAPLTNVAHYYKWYVLGDLINLGLSACVFYAIERKYMKNWFTKIAGLVLPFVYVVMYPLNSTLFGFSYLGMGITVIGMLIVIVDEYLDEALKERFAIAAMMLGCLALFESYFLFVPVTYFAILLCIFWKQFRSKKLFSLQTIVKCLAIFLLPCMIGMWYSYGGIFIGGVTVSTALVNEGGCYRDLYSNFLFFIPAGVLGYINLIRKKENKLITFLMPILLVFAVVMLWKAMYGSASSYYYYKVYFPIWLVLMALNFYAAAAADIQMKWLLASIFGVWCMLITIWHYNIDAKIQYHNENLVSGIRASAYVDLLVFNKTVLYWPAYEETKTDLYHYVYENLLSEGEESVPAVIDFEDSYWFQDMTDQRFYDWDFYWMDNEQLMDKLEEADANYIMVCRDCPLYINDSVYFESLEKVYDNGGGFVARYEKGSVFD